MSSIIHFTWLLAAAGSAIASPTLKMPQAALTAQSSNITLMGGSGYDQIRFLQCSTWKDETQSRMIAYYDHPPQGSDKPTQVAYRTQDNTPWGEVTSGSGTSSDGAGWNFNLNKYTWSEDIFQSYVGDISYGFTGFNCFVDDGHGAHYEPDGMCYCELYCTYQHAFPLAIDASKETVEVAYKATAQEGKTPPGLPSSDARAQVKTILEKANDGVGNQQCSPSNIDVGPPGCTMSLECFGGQPQYLQKLMDTLLKVYDTEHDLFKAIDEKDCFPQQPICNPEGKQCRYPPDLCDYRKGVEMPRKYVVSLVDRAPPNSGVSSPQLAQLTLTVSCASNKNDAFCSAMGTVAGLGSLFGPLSSLFGLAGMGITAGCGA